MADPTSEELARLRDRFSLHPAPHLKTSFSLSEREVCLIRDLAAQRRRSSREWRDISTAPKDGTRVLCYAPKSRRPVFEAWWARPFEGALPEHCWWQGCEYSHLAESITHWMPLPPPPVTPGCEPERGGER